MGFIQNLFLAGAATVVIPVIIHLIFKARKKRIIFSSIRFLQTSILRDSRRLRLRDLILLLLRCAAFFLIALAFARPYLYGQVLSGEGGMPREDLIIVLDDSPSMAAQDGSQSRWENALEKAGAECSTRRPGDRLGLVLGSEPGRPEIELSSNFASVLNALKRERPSDKRGDLALALRTAIDQMADSTASRRRVLVLSDWQANQIDRGAWTELAQYAAEPARPVSIELATPDKQAPKALNNVAITDVRPRSDVWIEKRPVPFAIRIQNHGQGEVTNLAVRLIVNDRVEAQRTVGLGPFGTTEVELAVRFETAGSVAGLVEIDAHDALRGDDRYFFAVELRDSVNTLVVEDQFRETESFFDQSYYLRMALDPRIKEAGSESPQEGVRGYVTVKTSPVAKLSPAGLKNIDVIFMVGVTSLPDTTLVTLEETVRKGCNLVLFLGRSDLPISDMFYNDKLFNKGEGLLPARLEGRFEGSLLEGKYNGLDAFKAEHPIFQPFAGENERDLRLPIYLRSYRLNRDDLEKGSQGPAKVAVLASLNDGQPFLVEQIYGKGKVLVFPFCPRPEKDTDLPKRKAFVPLIHQVVRYLAGVDHSSNRMLLAGASIDLSALGLGESAKARVEQPGKNAEVLEVSGAESVTAGTNGVYKAIFNLGGIATQAHWAVNLDPRESVLIPEDFDGLSALFTSNPKDTKGADGPVLRAQSSEELKAQAQDWRFYLLAALICLLLELLVRDFWGSSPNRSDAR